MKKISRKIYTFNFHRSTNPGDLKVFFNKFGKVQEVCIRKCKSRNVKHNQFAFVIFEEIDGARKALGAEPSELELNGHTLQVRYADSDDSLEKKTKNFEKLKRLNAESTYVTSVDGCMLEGDSCMPRKRNLGMNDLKDNCLFHIFSYFTLTEKIRLELVCKRWRGVLLEQWRITTYLNFEKEQFFKRLNNDILQGLLKKCGPSILKLDLPQFHQLRRSTVLMITDYCINLRHLSIQNLVLTSEDMQGLISNCKHLKSLELKHPVCGKYFGFIGKVLKLIPLESFVFMDKRCNCKFLSSLPSTLKHLELISCDKLVETHLLSGLLKVTNLQSFRITKAFDTLLFNKELYYKISNVEEFGATEIRRNPSSFRRPLHFLKHLHNIRKLSLKCSNLVDDSVLAKISVGCKKLEVLDISGCGLHNNVNKVSDQGIETLLRHCVLTDLSISHCPGFTDNGLSILANVGTLKKLSCGFCQNITDVGCSKLISLCLGLEVFNIEGCKKISAVVVASAMSTASLRSEFFNRKKTLHLFVKGTTILQSEIPDSSRSLEIHQEKYLEDCVVRKVILKRVKKRAAFHRNCRYLCSRNTRIFTLID